MSLNQIIHTFIVKLKQWEEGNQQWLVLHLQRLSSRYEIKRLSPAGEEHDGANHPALIIQKHRRWPQLQLIIVHERALICCSLSVFGEHL